MLNIIIFVVGILFITFLMKFYKEYKLRDKLPLLFMIPVLFMVYVIIGSMLYKLKFIESLSESYIFLVIFLIVVPVFYFVLLKYLLKTRIFSYFRNQVWMYIHSFRGLNKKFGRNILLSFALLAVFVVVLLVFIVFMRSNLTPIIKDVLPLLKAAQAEQDPEASQQAVMALLAQNNELIKEVITKSIIGLSLTLIVLLFVVVVSRGVIWSNILRQKYDKMFFRRFTFVSLTWLFLSLVVIALVLFLFELRVGVIIAPVLLLMFMYLKLMINLHFNKEKTIAKNLGSFKKGFTKFHKMIVPFVFIFSLAVILFILSINLLGWENKIYAVVMGVLLAALFVAFVNWARLYLNRVCSRE